MRFPDRLLSIAALLLAGLALAGRGSFGPSADATAVPAADELGPADALLLADARSGKEPLRVRNAEGRLAFGDRSTDRVWSVAAVDIDTCMKRILGTDSFAEKRKELDEDAKKQEDDFRKRLQEIQTRYGDIPPEHPRFPDAQREANVIFDAMRRWSEGQARIRGMLAAEQIEGAYRRLVDAVEVVADREKVDLVFRFLPVAKPFESDTMEGATLQVQGRTFLKSPDAIDLTAEVLKELGLENE